MTTAQLEKFKEWIILQIRSEIAGTIEDSEGYSGNNHNEQAMADRLFNELLTEIEDN